MKWKNDFLKRVGACLIMLSIGIPAVAQEVSEPLADFRELKTFSGVKVILVPSQENKIEITGHSKNEVSYDITGGRLEIRLPIDHIWSEDNTLIRIMGNGVEIIDANEGSIIETEGVVEASGLVIRAQEGATVKADVKAGDVSGKAVTGGIIELSGSAKEQEVEVNTGGKYLASDLLTQRTEIEVGTAGRGEVYVTDTCRATAKLGGVIQVLGNPEELNTKTSLGGKIL